MRRQPLKFFSDIGAHRGDRGFLRYALGIELDVWRKRFKTLLDPIERCLWRSPGSDPRRCDECVELVGGIAKDRSQRAAFGLARLRKTGKRLLETGRSADPSLLRDPATNLKTLLQ